MKKILLITSFIFFSKAAIFSNELDFIFSVINHLEFVGYRVRNAGTVLIAEKNNQAYIGFKPYNGGMLFYTHWPVSAGLTKEEAIVITNQLNADSTLARYYINDGKNLVIEAWIPEGYERLSFGVFISVWQEETYRKVINSLLFGQATPPPPAATPSLPVPFAPNPPEVKMESAQPGPGGNPGLVLKEAVDDLQQGKSPETEE